MIWDRGTYEPVLADEDPSAAVRAGYQRGDLKIMAISGGARMGNANFLDMARTMGADAIMEKPFEPEDLVAKVRQLLAE